jgi:transposase InsO family protein
MSRLLKEKHFVHSVPIVRWNLQKLSLQGASCPICSSNFRDRFQVDLVDMRANRRQSIYGIVMRYIVVMKDHFSGFGMADCIPRKRANFVAHVINHFFSIVGYPYIFHTDNGKEFTAKCILDLLCSRSPHITMVTGTPRTPSDQGLVKRANRTFKAMLYAFERQQRLRGETPNWTEGMPYCVSSMNCREVHGVGGVSLYQAVFNMPYEESEMAIPSDMRSCSSAYEQLNLIKNSNFANMVRQNQWDHEFEIPTESAVGNNDDYWSDTDSLDKTEGTLLTANKTVEQLSLEVGVETEIGNNLIKGLKIPMKSPVVPAKGPKIYPTNSSKTLLVTNRLSTAGSPRILLSPKIIPSAMLTKATALLSKGQTETASVTTVPSLAAYKPTKLPPIQRKPTISVKEAYSQNYATSHKSKNSNMGLDVC